MATHLISDPVWQEEHERYLIECSCGWEATEWAIESARMRGRQHKAQAMARENLGWYISDVHVNRALKYLYARFVGEEEVLRISERTFMDLWAEALEETMDANEPSPIGPEPEHARKFLLSGIEARVAHLEDRAERIETAIMKLGTWQTKNQRPHRGIEKILYGTEISSETSSPSAE